MQVHFARSHAASLFCSARWRTRRCNEFMNERGIFSSQPTLRQFSTRVVRKAADAILEKRILSRRRSTGLVFFLYRRESS